MLNDQVTSLSVSDPAGSNQSSDAIKSYLFNGVIEPLLIQGDVLTILKRIPSESIDMIMTSPPYWNQREYDSGGIGLEKNYQEFINLLLEITVELKRVLKPTGSFWLNMNDTYQNKHLLGIPWRIALKMIDEQGWILRNEGLWYKKYAHYTQP
ncbi:hypothetical protein A9308_09830 [Moraxella atlantae]|uniref:Methyltransferase n=1 Tax=Faucicola atlantae TaxID=34059 RepID=A0A1B8Q9D3_9GAMM|nr:DNA methyltransferase [Moraxella atlantae]OBX75007.1 hypothetical protein A9308_09830 [Moraxella atlantae]